MPLMTLWKAITSENDIFPAGVKAHKVGSRSITASESLWPANSWKSRSCQQTEN